MLQFDMVSTIRDKLLNAVGTEDIPHILVGNKSDLVHEREVVTEEGQRLADEWGVPFLESSAKYNMNVEEVSSGHHLKRESLFGQGFT